MPRTLTSYMFFCNYGEYDGQTIFTNQFWWIHWVNKKIMNSPQTNNQKKVKIKENKDSTKYETTLYATCRRNFNTVWGSTQHQKKFKPKANSNNITAHDITVQPTLKFFPSWTYCNLFLQNMRRPENGKRTCLWWESIDECTRLILEWINDSQLQSIAIKALMIMRSTFHSI